MKIAYADSLENLLKAHLLDDTVRVNLLNKYATFILEDANKRRDYATQAGELADKFNYPKGKAESLWLIEIPYVEFDNQMAKSLNNRAMAYRKVKNNKASIEVDQKALEIAEEHHEEALEYFRKALKICEKIGGEVNSVTVLIYLVDVYVQQKKCGIALAGTLKGLALAYELKFKDS